MTERDITKITDYPLIQKLAQALWQSEDDGHGVAIMVGAGFSRSAATTQDINKKMPIWANLAKKIAEELGEEEHTDALRLAQMYQDYFGKQTLYDLLKNEIDDEIWQPAELYQQLLTLPWTEVLTTNWDTLLERAARDIHEPIYDIVNKQEDLACCHSPRIVKLHGTINLSSDLIFTQEDYRHYPKKYGIFVNFVRQVFVENELCLIGFSGDDPNFLQWIGWVRDNLQSNARRIYLVGALNLSSAKRKYLESLNVAPIDLFELVADIDDGDLKHKTAIELFLTQLSNFEVKKVWNWTPEHFDKIIELSRNQKAIEIEKALGALKMDRESYPDWIICPDSLRAKIFDQSCEYVFDLLDTELENTMKNNLLYELAWRYGIIFHYNISSDFQKMLLAICEPDANSGLSVKQHLEIALYLLKCTRFTKKDSDQQEIIDKTTKILTANGGYWHEGLVELYYHQVLVAWDELNYPLMEKLVDKIQGADPVWKLRKAFILSEITEFKESEMLVDNVFNELIQSYKRSKYSAFILSRLAWAKYFIEVINYINNKKLSKKIKKISPIYNLEYDILDSRSGNFELIEPLEKEISNCLEKQQEKDFIPLFKSGYYSDISIFYDKKLLKNNIFNLFIRFDCFYNTVGLPIFMKDLGLIDDTALKLAKLENLDSRSKFSLAVRASSYCNSIILKTILSRNNIAKMHEDEINEFVENCCKAINYWAIKYQEKSNNANKKFIFNRLTVFIEILARLQIRVSVEKAIESFNLAITLLQNNFFGISTSESLKNLYIYSMESIPICRHHELLITTLNDPLVEEPDRLNPVIYNPGNRNGDIITKVINKLIATLETEFHNTEVVKNALERLLPLIKKNYLTKEEKNKLKMIVRNQNKYDTFIEIPIWRNFIFTIFNDEDQPKIEQLKQSIITKVFLPIKPNSIDYLSIRHIHYLSKNCDIYNRLAPESAKKYFDILINWRYSENNIIFDFPVVYSELELGILIGEILHFVIVPALSDKEKNQIRFDALCKFYNEVQSEITIQTIVLFVLANPKWQIDVKKLINKNLKSRDERVISNTVYAILTWGKGLQSDKTKLTNSFNRVIRPLVIKLLNFVDLGQTLGLSTILYVIDEMFNNNWLINKDIDILVENLPQIFANTDYLKFKDSDKEVIMISTLRANCIKLARDILKNYNSDLLELQKMLRDAKKDPLPEVRFAESNNYSTI